MPRHDPDVAQTCQADLGQFTSCVQAAGSVDPEIEAGRHCGLVCIPNAQGGGLRHNGVAPLIGVRQEGPRGGTEIFVYTHDAQRLFAQTTSILEQLGLTVVDARIITSRSGYTLDSYVVLDDSGAPIEASYRLDEIRDRLQQGLVTPLRAV